MFGERELLLTPLQTKLANPRGRYRVVAPRLPPVAGAALYAAKLSAAPLDEEAIGELERQVRG
jgi:hypothetical protein